MGPKSIWSPWYSATSLVQIAFMASTLSRMRPKRRSKSAPWSAISSAFQPAPTPRQKRPFDTTSRLATSFAVWMGSRWITNAMPVPSLSVLVVAAAAVSATNGSRVS